jgi:hypothetical protein
MSFVELSTILGSWGEFIGSIAVVVTLIYLAIQVRQNSQQIRDNVSSLQVSAYQDLMSRIADMNKLSIENPEWVEIVQKASRNPDELTDSELSRYFTYTIMLTRHADMAFMQYERGLLDRERFISSLGPLIGVLRSSALAREQVRRNALGDHSIFTVAFQQELEQLVREAKSFAESNELLPINRLREDLLKSLNT